jgi:hypothetical protein
MMMMMIMINPHSKQQSPHGVGDAADASQHSHATTPHHRF